MNFPVGCLYTRTADRETAAMYRSLLVSLALSVVALLPAAAQPPAGKEPIPRLEAGGPTGFVTSLVLSPDGRTLYAAGYDQVVRWSLTDQGSGDWSHLPSACRSGRASVERSMPWRFRRTGNGSRPAGRALPTPVFARPGSSCPNTGLSASGFAAGRCIDGLEHSKPHGHDLGGDAGVVVGMAFGRGRQAATPGVGS